MAPTPRLSIERVVESAIGVTDSDGFDGLSVSAVASDLAVAPSALYTYCDGVDGLRHLVAIAATRNLTVDLQRAATGIAGGPALVAMSDAYRAFAARHPGQFAATQRPPKRDDGIEAANRSLLEVFALVYLGMGHSSEQSHLAARSTRSALHGFLALEHATGTTDDHDREYRHLLETLQRGLA
jgi:AcrR family transcriptional regulator